MPRRRKKKFKWRRLWRRSNLRRSLKSLRQSLTLFRARRSGRTVVHMLHVGKTGGTAVKAALRAHRQGQEFIIQLQRHSVGLQNIPAGDKVIFFLRDPIRRFVSGFYSRQNEGRPKYFVRWRRRERVAFKNFNSPEELAIALGSEDPELRKTAEKAMRAIQHVNSSYWDWFKNEAYFRARLNDLFFIGFQETLANDFAALRRKLKLPDHVGLPEDDVVAHRNPRSSGTKLSEQAQANLRHWYQRDYEFLELCRRLAPQVNGTGGEAVRQDVAAAPAVV